ncbi:MAG: nucleotidyltransferase domain-containing protein [Coriobacteriia bacterium]|nr:nucleotidyltransferase domain-containing protein [Coriobacteriia bacterium]
MDAAKVLTLAQSYAIAVHQEYPKADVYLFGSHASGTAHSDSDIDIAIVVNKVKGNWLDRSAQLWKLSQRFSNHIEPVLLEADYDTNGFVCHVRKTGILL